MSCHAMLCYAMPCQTKFCPGLTQVHKSGFFDVQHACLLQRRQQPRQRSDESGGNFPRWPYPPPTDIARALVPVPEVLRHGCCNQLPSPRGTRDSPPPPVGGPLRTTRNGNLVPMVAYSEPSAFAAAPAHAPAPISLSTFSRAGLSTPFAVDLPCSVSYPNHVYCGTGARRSCRLQIENSPCMSRQSQFSEGRMPLPGRSRLCARI